MDIKQNFTSFQIFHKSQIRTTPPQSLPSSTVTTKTQDAVMPDGSAKMYDTCVEPVTKKSPGLCELDEMTTVPELSVAVGWL